MSEPTRMTEAPDVHDHATGLELEQDLTVPDLAGVPEDDEAEPLDAAPDHVDVEVDE